MKPEHPDGAEHEHVALLKDPVYPWTKLKLHAEIIPSVVDQCLTKTCLMTQRNQPTVSSKLAGC